MPRVARVFFQTLTFLIILGMAAAAPSWAQETDAASEIPSDETTEDSEEDSPVLSSEASAYLLDLNIGDVGVDLLWDGYWRMTFVAGGGFGQVSQETAFSGLSQGVSFFQEPDVTLSLWLNNRWFIETTFLEGFERNTYRAGYMGREDEFVRHVIIGNAGVNAESYAEIDVPAPSYNTPGIAARFGTDKSDHELLLRFDPTEAQSKTFQGEYEVNTQDIGLPEFIQGRYFLLPDTGVSNVAVYLEDRLGTINGTDGLGVIRKYRQAEPGEFFVDNDTGTVVLAEAHDGQVVAYYSVGASDVGDVTVTDFVVTPDANLHPDLDAGTFEDFDFVGAIDPYDTDSPQRAFSVTSQVTIAGNSHLVLYDPNRFTPFERQNVYLSSRPLPEETWRIVPLVQDRGALYPSATPPDYGFIPDTSDKTVAVYGAVGDSDGLRAPANRYPFAGADPEVYGPGRETDPDKISRIMVLAIREANPGFFLGTGVVPGSVVVRVNGVRDKSVSVGDDGRIEFNRYIYLDDWIEVSYRTESLDLDGGDLFIYQGNKFQLGPRLTWELAESVRWNISDDRSAEEYGESPGEIKVATTLDWEADNAALRLTGDVALTTPDTAGNLRLFGMDKGGLGLAFYSDTVVAAPQANSILPETTEPALLRSDADKFDYVSTGVLGGETLNDYLWSSASDTGNDGPAVAARRSGDPANGRVFEMRFDTPDGNWSAADFLADPAGPIDLSGHASFEFPIMFRNDHNGVSNWSVAPSITLQAGEIGEGEDHHEDGTVHGVNPGAMLEWDLFADPDSGSLANAWTSTNTWETLTIKLSPQDQAKLSSVRSFRIILNNGSGNPLTGRIIIGAPRFAGSPFRTEVRDASDVLVTGQWISGEEAADTELFTEFSETRTLFHPNGESNRALKVDWGTNAAGGSDIAADERWEAVSWFDGIPPESYRTMVFYVKDEDAIGGNEMTATTTDTKGRGITVTWTTPAGGGWDRITVNVAEGTATSARGAAGIITSVDASAESLTRFVLAGVDETGTAVGDRSGTVWLDEIHFKEPAFLITGGAELQGEWAYPDDVWAAGNFPILGDITLDGRVAVAGGAVVSGLDKGNSVYSGSIAAGADLLGVGVKTDWRGTWGLGTETWAGSHSLRIPARSQVFWVDDAYARGESGDDISFSRETAMNLNLAPGSIRVYTDALYDGINLIQGWGGYTAWGGKNWNTELDVRYVLNTLDTPEGKGDYFSSWITDYALIAPSTAEAVNREAHHTLGTGFTWGVFGLNWDPELRMKAARSPVWNQENRWAGTLSMPLKFEQWSLTSSYRRDLKQVVDISTAGDARSSSYGDAWAVWSDYVGSQFPLATYVPFRELFGDADAAVFAEKTEGLAEVDYESEFALDLSRNSGNGIIDLFLPVSGDFSMERRYHRKGDTVGWENEWRGSLGFHAANLFGRFGRHPILPLYNTEELLSLFQITLDDYNGVTVPGPDELLWQTNWTFTGNRERKLALDYRISWHWDPEARDTRQEGRLEFLWRTDSKDVLRLPLFKRAIPRQHYIQNKERFSIVGLHPWADAPPEAYGDIGFLIYHETAWVFQDAGHIMGWLALGLGQRNQVLTNGWEIGIEAEFRF